LGIGKLDKLLFVRSELELKDKETQRCNGQKTERLRSIPNLPSSKVRNQNGGDGASGKMELGPFFSFFLLNRKTWS